MNLRRATKPLFFLAICWLLAVTSLAAATQSPSGGRWAALQNLGITATPAFVEVDTLRQKLTLYLRYRPSKTYFISTSAKGPGQLLGSLQTPRGLHRIYQKFGAGEPPMTIFKVRKSIGKQWTCRDPEQNDLILTRILALEGLQRGLNRGHDKFQRCVDSRLRCIYLHGTHEEHKIGTPASHGCIRMRNADILELFLHLPVGAQVWIS